MIRRLLLYTLLALVPIQLGRHFFFDFSFIAGIRSDYLVPTIYLTDIAIGTLFGIEMVRKLKAQNSKFISQILRRKKQHLKPNSRSLLLVFVIFYLLFSAFFIATNKWAAIYKTVKIIELVFLAYIIVDIKPKLFTALSLLSVGAFYSSIIAVCQFLFQKPIGGVLWWLGERSFYASTPGIALFSLPSWFGLGKKIILRPYATFPHPNVLGGFLAVVLPLFLFIIIYKKKDTPRLAHVWYLVVFILGFLALVFSLSKAAWIVFGLGSLLVIVGGENKLRGFLSRNNHTSLILFYVLLIFSIFIPIVFPTGFFTFGQSWQDRAFLIKGALQMAKQKPMFGFGLNNFVVRFRDFALFLDGLLVFQPVHNIYLLVFVESGIVGFTAFLLVLQKAYLKSLKNSSIVLLAIVQFVFLGFFDHYIFTLQQTQLLFTVFISLAFLPQNA